MSFESIKSLEIELEQAVEQNDREYAHQIRYNIMMWSLKGEGYGTLFDLDEVEPHKNCNALEREGACRLFAEWCVDHELDGDMLEAYDNLSGERDDGWTCMEPYTLPQNKKLRVLGCMVNGSCVYAEIWYEDSKTGFIRIN